ncbi:uncharacterized protein PHACADRAFT_201808 [Phanerochaete carnosa HHB-10118-sp]|uniref:Uncharacterized protein n=1 Tax=Phanerochaete carnosa (strain HHB-10118-sp) TaxID=650164 RepID=K5WGL3_PHACS|nr:uncharacterized protein PHACADRAFT_201808 [Phanerochaete carnosa HHB-10118-sp]EKM49302.1 hypothetical protein PHACADRAFT_201808 [Phanerochaete carnosa HHB-10118-sp]
MAQKGIERIESTVSKISIGKGPEKLQWSSCIAPGRSWCILIDPKLCTRGLGHLAQSA